MGINNHFLHCLIILFLLKQYNLSLAVIHRGLVSWKKVDHAAEHQKKSLSFIDFKSLKTSPWVVFRKNSEFE
jgi:hypothetical protein